MPVKEKEYVAVEVPVPVETTKIVEVEKEVPVFVEPAAMHPVDVVQIVETSEKRVVLPQMKPAEIAQKQTVMRQVPVPQKELVMEKELVAVPQPPQPVIVKTIHDETIVTEAPTDIHHVELKKPEAKVARSAPPAVRAAVQAPEPQTAAFCTRKWWICLLPLLCCLPLLGLLCLLCCSKKKLYPGPIQKPPRG